jgi:hypothetical protein
MKGNLLWLVCWASLARTKDLIAALVGPVQFNSFVPIAKPAEQASMLGRLSLSMCLWGYRFGQYGKYSFVPDRTNPPGKQTYSSP